MQVIDCFIGRYYWSVENVHDEWIDLKLKLSDREIIPALNQKGVNASVSGRAGAVIDFEKKGVDWALRFSPHYYNTTAELDRAVEALQQLLV